MCYKRDECYSYTFLLTIAADTDRPSDPTADRERVTEIFKYILWVYLDETKIAPPALRA